MFNSICLYVTCISLICIKHIKQNISNSVGFSVLTAKSLVPIIAHPCLFVAPIICPFAHVGVCTTWTCRIQLRTVFFDRHFPVLSRHWLRSSSASAANKLHQPALQVFTESCFVSVSYYLSLFDAMSYGLSPSLAQI